MIYSPVDYESFVRAAVQNSVLTQHRSGIITIVAVLAIVFLVLRMPGMSYMVQDMVHLIRIVAVLAMLVSGGMIVHRTLRKMHAPPTMPTLVDGFEGCRLTPRRPHNLFHVQDLVFKYPVCSEDEPTPQAKDEPTTQPEAEPTAQAEAEPVVLTQIRTESSEPKQSTPEEDVTVPPFEAN